MQKELDKLLKTAAQYIFERSRRKTSLLGIFVIAFVFFILIIPNGLLDALDSQSLNNIIDFESGHIKITAKDNLYLDTPQELMEKLILDSRVKAVTSRVVFKGMVSNGTDQIPVTIFGIDSASDQKVFKLSQTLSAGNFVSGETLVLGNLLAENIGAKIGDWLRIVCRTRANVLSAFDAEVSGLVSTTDPVFDKEGVILSLAQADQYLGLGGAVGEIDLRLSNKKFTNSIAKHIKDAFSGITVSTYKDFTSEFEKISQVKIWLKLIRTKILTLVILLVVGTVLFIEIFSRNKEVDIKVFAAEGGILVLCGGIFGVLLSLILNLYFVFFGLHFFPGINNLEIGYPVCGRLYSNWNILETCVLCVMILVLSILTSLGLGWVLARCPGSQD